MNSFESNRFLHRKFYVASLLHSEKVARHGGAVHRGDRGGRASIMDDQRQMGTVIVLMVGASPAQQDGLNPSYPGAEL